MSTVLESLNTSLHQAMTRDERVYMIGEDLMDPYGGAFKVTRGLSTEFPERVLTTPVSEAGIVGLAGGMALRGLRPVVEIMFGDFITLAADQLINGITKFHWMYNQQVNVPIVVRLPMGGRRGYGPTHSQTLEKLFLGVPGLRVLAPSALGNPGDLLERAILEDDGPVLFVENKLLYLQDIIDPSAEAEFVLISNTTTETYAPTYSLTLRDSPPPILTLTAYGYMAELARAAVLKLAYEHEIFCEMIVLTQLSPFESKTLLPVPLLTSIQRTQRLLTIEEGGITMGWGAEVVARASEAVGDALQSATRVAARDIPIPASVSMEEMVLPSVDTIVQAAKKMV
ncbi:MAG: alpha-ketoacid dehydrogenase subunit beta [Chloroflexi bacterium]|nr:alpha-ketoacid dehydrogenase subunit beta [Chloroflexota bacterium]